ncbi:RES family NAD+ phosphorylase [Allohahella marinimesophila]|uniref:RES family NAD+ phosphorylase n=1 Tax=Allohahella marinimesophila TaxID=1054972 RepID=A0ABP7PZ62_9GAMM
MELYRIAPERYLENYSGRGGSFESGGRWNSAGHPVMYMALAASVALLEIANYISSPRMIPPSFKLGTYTLDTSVVNVDELAHDKLPESWRAFPYPQTTQAIGDAWITAGHALVLILPSAASPSLHDRIALINALHPDIKHLSLISSSETLYNGRMFR